MTLMGERRSDARREGSRRCQMKIRIESVLIVLCLATFFSFSGHAGAEIALDGKGHKTEIETALFSKDKVSFQFTTGLLFSPTLVGASHRVLNYEQTNLRLSLMLTDPKARGSFFRGNLEAIAEFSTSFVTKGFGNIIIGPALLFRYNFVQPGSKFIPYIQAGAGIYIIIATKIIPKALSERP